MINRRQAFIILTAFLGILFLSLLYIRYYHDTNTVEMVMGGTLNKIIDDENGIAESEYTDVEKYFRPSELPVLNDRYTSMRFFDDYFEKKASELKLPGQLFKTPEDTIINYFSILREAANPRKGTNTGCGTLGNAGIPYPVAYNFLSSSYQKKLSYDKFLETFKNILHISLIKYREVPVYDNTSGIQRYFVEIETIEGSDKNMAYFAYYYGFVDLVNEDGLYKISNLDFYGEDFLCAPYHGWSHDAEGSVQVRYGGWCSFIEEMYPVQQDGYIKNIYFKGKDGNDYLIQFFQLTNDTDIEIAQYRKREDGKWELIKLDPNECIKDKSS